MSKRNMWPLCLHLTWIEGYAHSHIILNGKLLLNFLCISSLHLWKEFQSEKFHKRIPGIQKWTSLWSCLKNQETDAKMGLWPKPCHNKAQHPCCLAAPWFQESKSFGISIHVFYTFLYIFLHVVYASWYIKKTIYIHNKIARKGIDISHVPHLPKSHPPL